MDRQEEFENAIKTMLEIIGEDTNREGLVKTPNRVFRSFIEMTQGYHQDPVQVLNDALFETDNNQMVLIKDIEFYSMCEHHLLPIIGRAHVAYIPDGKVVGLSKLNRIVNFVARRPQVQERLNEQIYYALQYVLGTDDIAVLMDAEHLCVKSRGIGDQQSGMTTSKLGGAFFEDGRLRNEFMQLAVRR